MEIKLEVLLSSSIKRKKPWPRFCWLGKEKEAVFLLDDSRISEISLPSGQTKKKTPKLQPFLQRVVTMSSSQNGLWLAGILVSGELFLWNKDKDCVKTVAPVTEVQQLVSEAKATSRLLSLLVSGDGRKVLLASVTGKVFIWECLALMDLSGPRDVVVKGRWAQITASENSQLPPEKHKEASLHCVFVQSQALGDVCLTAFVFTSGMELTVTFLKLQWEEETRHNRFSSGGPGVQWATKSYPLNHMVPPCQPVISRGALVPAFSPDGHLLAVIVNQQDPRATQVLFISVQNFVTVSSSLGGCGSKKLAIPSKYVRSYWVGSASWTPSALYLACMLKRGSLLLLSRLGGLVSLSTFGCDIEFGTAHFLPIHPLITYSPPASSKPPDEASSGSGASLQDPMKQRFSVTWHPRLPCLIISDGYMVTMMRMASQPSPAILMSALLLDVAQRLERVRTVLGSQQPQVRRKLESMSTLKFVSSLKALKEKEIPTSTLPQFLQAGANAGGSRQLGEREKVEDGDAWNSDDSLHAGSVDRDGGRLQFASMFDTLHAQTEEDSGDDSEQSSSPLPDELATIRRSLLAAWALGVSVCGGEDQDNRLLKYAVSCAVRLARLLCVTFTTLEKRKKANWVSHVFTLLRALLSFLPWSAIRGGGGGGGSSCCFGAVVELSRSFARLFVPPSNSGVCSSQNFAAALIVLREASRSVDRMTGLSDRTGVDQSRYPSDLFTVPLLQEDVDGDAAVSRFPPLNRPSVRLLNVWREVYRQALRYQAKLRKQSTLSHRKKEPMKMVKIIAQIQEVLQRAGDHLEESHALHNVTGEQHFIFGEYSQCVQTWRVQLWAESERAGPRTAFLETRYCLALLFGFLFGYRLREAQAMCDCLARKLQQQSGLDLPEEKPETGNEAPFDAWLPQQVNAVAARAVVQSLGRFMASYFTNQPLTICPPHNVDILPPLHLPQSSGRRMVVLSQSLAAAAVRSQQLSAVWTVDYALEVLLLGGLMPETVWLAHHLGDWKAAASLGLAYTTYCSQHHDYSSLKWKELHLPEELQPSQIFQTKLELLLGCTAQNFPEDLDDPDALQVSVQELLKVSVMAEVDVVSQPLTQLLDLAKDRASALSTLVPPALYLPAPPLYCPQPAPNTQDPVGDAALALEKELRCQVASALQRVLLLLRAARCSRPATSWYIRRLRRCRQLFRKIKKGNVESKGDLIPEGLRKLAAGRDLFHSGADGDRGVQKAIICFRELCGLCWMLHVRDQLTVSCRRYQKARSMDRYSQATDVMKLCVDSLRWALRLLPFSRFLSAEETLQDLVLSLVAELPPVPMVAESLVRVFPDEEESVRVALREKYNLLLRRLEHTKILASASKQDAQPCHGNGDEDGETMLLFIQDRRRQRVREQRRLARCLAPAERHLWEREEEEERVGVSLALKRFSLDTSLSNSTDCERTLGGGEGDTWSEPLSDPGQRSRLGSKSIERKDTQKEQNGDGDGSKTAIKRAVRHQSIQDRDETAAPLLPAVGTWEFELEDEEFPHFLELFLCWLLEKDSQETDESELPLLSCFSSQLRDRELHSDTFNMLTTFKRLQSGRKHDVRLPIFSLGRCFSLLPETSKPALSALGLAPSFFGETVVQSLLGKRPGLFGLRDTRRWNLFKSDADPNSGHVPTSIPRVRLMERGTGTVSRSDLELQVELDSEMEARFPVLARLVEWMLRWADRSVPVTRACKKNSEENDEPVFIRAKVSAPAVLTALKMMAARYSSTEAGTEKRNVQLADAERKLPKPDSSWTRESSVDTGYPASAETPVVFPELEHLHAPNSDPFEDEKIREDLSLSHYSEHEDVMSDAELKEDDTRQETKPLQLTRSEDEGSASETSRESEHGPNIAVRMESQHGTPGESRDQTFTLAELDGSESVDKSDAASQPTPRAEARRETPFNSMHEASDPASTHQRHTSVPESSAGPETAEQPPQDGAHGAQNAVSGLGQDELLRLVQLQQINFMSLMQVVGASFVNLHLSQSNALLSQLSNSAPAQTQPQPSPNRAPSSQNARPENEEEPKSAPEPHSAAHRAADQQVSSAGPKGIPGSYQRQNSGSNRFTAEGVPTLTVRPDPSGDGRRDGACFIPRSQGLLTTVESQAPPSARPRHHHHTSENSVPAVQGLRLLKLPPSQAPPLRPPPLPVTTREAWGSQTLRSESAFFRRAEEDRTSDFNPNHDRYSSQTHRQVRPGSSEAAPVGSHFTSAPSVQTRPLQLPLISLTAPNPKQTSAAPPVLGNYTKLQLLRCEKEPASVASHYTTAPVRIPHLIPLEQLMAWTAGTRQGDVAKLQLLKANLVKESNTAISQKRLRRRVRMKKAASSHVSFRPEESIIPPPKPEQDAPVQDAPVQDDGYAIPLGSFESTLTGQKLLAEARSTSAELHAFAATLKQAPEIQDACTNTEPVPSRPVTDKAVSAQLPASPDPAATHAGCVVSTPVVTERSERSFLNVNSSELDSLDRSEPNAAMFQEVRRSASEAAVRDDSPLPPTPAQLHLLAATVTSSAPPNSEIYAEQQSDQRLDCPASFAPLPVENSESEPGGDPLTVRILTELRTPDEAAINAWSLDRSSFPRSGVTARLSEMDAQLAALQSIADHMDREFANTRLLVNTIETLSSAMTPSEEDEVDKSPRFRKEGKRHRSAVRHAGGLENIEEKDEARERVFLPSTPVRSVAASGLTARSSRFSAAEVNRASFLQVHAPSAAKPEQPSWDTSQELAGLLLDNSDMPEENALNWTGLTDVADILTDLVRQGALSNSTPQPHSAVARLDRSTSMMEEERKELRAWMRRKQRERLMEYRKQLEEKRSRERQPFTSSTSLNVSSRQLKMNKEKKEEKDRKALQEHHSRRTREACHLIADLLTSPLGLPRSSSAADVRALVSRPKSRSLSTGRISNSPGSRKERARSSSALGRTVVLQKRVSAGPSGTLSSRLGLHRPASALPGDRLSQVTRRGMITDVRGRRREKTSAQRPRTGQRAPPAVRRPSEAAREEEEMMEAMMRDVVSPWDTPPEICQILRRDAADHARHLANHEHLDALSESTGSTLSKLDWDEIERIVAEERKSERP